MFNFISGDLDYIYMENDLCTTTKNVSHIDNHCFARFYIKYQKKITCGLVGV